MNTEKLATVVLMASILVMILWGFIGNDWGHSWIAAVVGVFGSMIIRIIGKNDDKK